jgi:integrase
LDHFRAWGGELPCSPDVLAKYIAEHGDKLKVSTLVRRLSSLAKAHRLANLPDPTKSELVKTVLRGIKRAHGSRQEQAKPVTRDMLEIICSSIGQGLHDIRDRALFLVGFASGMRRSELCSLQVEQVKRTDAGAELLLLRSKNDKDGKGRVIKLVRTGGSLCPVQALHDWLEYGALATGPLFRPIDRWGRVLNRALSGEAVGELLRRRLSALGIDPSGFTGHSFRAGFVSAAVQQGEALWRVRHQTGHASDQSAFRYIRCALNPVNVL